MDDPQLLEAPNYWSTARTSVAAVLADWISSATAGKFKGLSCDVPTVVALRIMCGASNKKIGVLPAIDPSGGAL